MCFFDYRVVYFSIICRCVISTAVAEIDKPTHKITYYNTIRVRPVSAADPFDRRCCFLKREKPNPRDRSLKCFNIGWTRITYALLSYIYIYITTDVMAQEFSDRNFAREILLRPRKTINTHRVSRTRRTNYFF